jgi:hypothetical protein
LIRGGATAENGVLWERAGRGTAYVVAEPG